MRIIAFILFVLFSVYSYADTFDASKSAYKKESIQKRLNNMSQDIHLPFTAETRRIIRTYTHTYRSGAQRILERGELYFPAFDYKLEQMGLPKVLKNLSIVESNLDPWSFSTAGAAGVWQLMPHTARSHGLIIDGYVDERLDPLKSGDVAFTYLRDLYEYFGDWNLALTAYNCGPMTLRRIIKECNSYDYKVIKDRLPRESARFISRLAAASYLTRYSDDHSLYAKSNYTSALTGIEIHNYISYSEISKLTGLTKSQITSYNPAVMHDFIPTSSKGYRLYLPMDHLLTLLHTKNWSYDNIVDLHYHLPELEKRIVFHNPYRSGMLFHIDNEVVTQANRSIWSKVHSMFAYRREQVMKLTNLA
jgi:membrane-bound lytic murein transglycosylase D